MSADVIDLHRRRIDEAPGREDHGWSAEARRAIRERIVAINETMRKSSRPTIAADDPIYALFDAYKEARAKYDAAMSEMARRAGLPKKQMAALMVGARKH